MKPINEWAYIGLLTDQQKQAGFFISQDEDFIYLLSRDSNRAKVLAIWDYETATIKEIRETAEAHRLQKLV